jgi:hypothetical protein
MGIWICREKAFWRDLLWTPGEPPNEKVDIVPFEGRKWVYDGGAWVPEGVAVIDAKAGMMIPAQFEPLDFQELANPRDVILARNRRKTERTWRFKHEIEDIPADLNDIPDPQPLNMETIAALREDPDVLVTAPPIKKRVGRPPLSAKK